jgi:hypothetical protein
LAGLFESLWGLPNRVTLWSTATPLQPLLAFSHGLATAAEDVAVRLLTLDPHLDIEPFSYFDPHCMTHQENKVGSIRFFAFCLSFLGLLASWWWTGKRP